MTESRHLHLRGALGAATVEMWDGREHLVIPTVALMEGVIHAVNAEHAEFVSQAALAASVDKWNGHPVVLGHPTRNGKQISAHGTDTPAIGFIRRANMNGTRLGHEILVDPARMKELGHGALADDLRAGKGGEVSVGAFVQTRAATGEHRGKRYAGEWATIGPDHLALLPGGIGACSNAMGCGLNRVAEGAYLVTAEGFEALGGPGSGPRPGGGSDFEKNTNPVRKDAKFGDQVTAMVDGQVVTGHIASPGTKPGTFQIKTEYGQVEISKSDLRMPKGGFKMRGNAKGLSMKRSLSERFKAAMKPLLKTLDDVSDDDDLDETAEDISYAAMLDLVTQAEASMAAGRKHVEALADENGPGDDEGVEDAHLEALVAMCVQLYGTINGVMKLATSQLAPDDAPLTAMGEFEALGGPGSGPHPSGGIMQDAKSRACARVINEHNQEVHRLHMDGRHVEANALDKRGPVIPANMRGLLGKEISAKNAKSIQAAHDASHTMHTSTVALGAQCNGMKLLAAKQDGESLDERKSVVSAAVSQKFGNVGLPGSYAYAQTTFDDHVIINKNEKLYSVDYKVSKDGSIEFTSDPEEVKIEYIAAGGRISEGDIMTNEARTAAIKTLAELKDANYSPCDLKGIALLSDAGIATLVTLAAKSPADAIIQAKANADAALAGHAHGLNAQDAADTAKKAAADKAK